MANNEDLLSTVSFDCSVGSIELCNGLVFLHDKSKGCRSEAASDEAGDKGDLLWADRIGDGLFCCLDLYILASCGCLCWLVVVVELDDEDEEEEEDDDEEDEDRVGDEDELGVDEEFR